MAFPQGSTRTLLAAIIAKLKTDVTLLAEVALWSENPYYGEMKTYPALVIFPTSGDIERLTLGGDDGHDRRKIDFRIVCIAKPNYDDNSARVEVMDFTDAVVKALRFTRLTDMVEPMDVQQPVIFSPKTGGPFEWYGAVDISCKVYFERK